MMEEVVLDVIMFCDDGCVNASILTIGLHQRTQDANIMIAVNDVNGQSRHDRDDFAVSIIFNDASEDTVLMFYYHTNGLHYLAFGLWLKSK